MDKKQLIGLITITAIVGGTVYFIKKYKDSLEEEAPMTAEEAKAYVELHKYKAAKTTAEVAKELNMNESEVREIVEVVTEEADPRGDIELHYDFYDDVDWDVPLSETITEEEKKLRFDKDSIQAKDQFIKMELADLTPGQQEYQIMRRLFDFQFEPLNDGDIILHGHLIDYRTEFFGINSRWNEHVTMGDVVAHYARRLDYNISNGVGHWICHILHYLEISELASSQEIGAVIDLLNQHKYENKTRDTYGFFGLHFDYIVEAEEMAEKNIDGQLTYDIEFNVFLNSIV